MSDEGHDSRPQFPVGTSREDQAFRQIWRLIAGFRGYGDLADLRAADGQVRESWRSTWTKR